MFKTVIVYNYILICCCQLLTTSNGFIHDDYHNMPQGSAQFRGTKNVEDKSYWNQVGRDELYEALAATPNTNLAKNVILFVGDGMSIPSITAARIYVGQQQAAPGEEGLLSFEKFPHVGLSKTYAVNFQVPDSASTGTALLTGVKTNLRVLGCDERVSDGKCETMTEDSLVDSIVKWSQDSDKKTGIVTSTRVTHATPASAYAHIVERGWECDSFLPTDTTAQCPNLKDIARQLVEDEPGRSLNLIMGGGFQELDAFATGTEDDPLSISSCLRLDGRQLWKTWLDNKTAEGKAAFVVRSKQELDEIDIENTQYLMGLFSNSHLPFEYQIRENALDVPTLSEMTEKAIQFLSKGPNGYFLLVESGRIDHGHHTGRAKVALDEIAGLNKAIEIATQLTDEKDTLIVVTADHSHTISMSGYPLRGSPITGLVTTQNASDHMPYTILNYANGPGFGYTADGENVVRTNVENVDMNSFDYLQQAAIPRTSETHGGDDVTIYARGPWAHLFHSVHEQNFVAHTMAYASCVGDYANEPRCM